MESQVSGEASERKIPISIARREWSLIAAVGLFSILFSGYQLADLFVYLPLAAYLRDPTLYPASPLIANLLAMPYPLYRLYAVILDQHALFFVFVLIRILLVLSLFYFTARIATNRFAAWLGVVLILFAPAGFATLGMTTLLLPDPVQQALAVPFLVLALALALDRRYLAALALAGAAFNLHPMLGAAVLTMLAGQLLLLGWRREHLHRTQVLGALGLGLVLTAPTILPTALRLGGQVVQDDRQFVEIVRFAVPFHTLPSTFTAREYVSTLLALFYVALAFRLRPHTPALRAVAVWLGVIALWCVVGGFFSEVYPVAFFLRLMPFRSTLFIRVIALACAGIYLDSRLAAPRTRDWLIVAFSLYGFLLDERVLLVAVAIDLAFSNRSPLWRLCGALSAIVLAAATILKGLALTTWPPFLDWVILDPRKPFGHAFGLNTLLAIGVGALILLLGLVRSRSVRLWPTNLARSPMMVLAWPALGLALLVIALAPGPLARRIHIPLVTPLDAVEEVALWARANTPVQSVFVTPPTVEWGGFTFLAGRSTVGDYKQAGQSLLDPYFARIIYQRLLDLGCTQPWCVDASYFTFDEVALRTVAARYNACYAITTQPLRLVEKYRQSPYHVYQLCNP